MDRHIVMTTPAAAAEHAGKLAGWLYLSCRIDGRKVP